MDQDCFEGFEELFGLEITNDDLTESFNSGPITFENLFEETDLSIFDSIVPDDISSFLATEIKEEVGEDIKITEDVFNINIENVYDNNNNKSDNENINIWDNLDLGIEGDTCQIKDELRDSPEIEMSNDNFLSLECNVNQVPFVDFFQVSSIDPKIGQVGSNESNEESTNKTKRDQIHHNVVSIVENVKREAKKYPILTLVNQERTKEENRKTNKGNLSSIRKLHIKDSKSFHFCNLCPFKTKEKSIIRMHQSFVHKMDAPKFEKKTTSQKSETVGRSYLPQPPKDYRCKKSQAIPIKNATPTINNFDKKCPTFVTPTPQKMIFPTLQKGFQGSVNNSFPSSALQYGDVKVEIGGSQLFTLPSGVMSVVNCQVIKPPPKKPVSILPKQPDFLLNRFHQTGGNVSQKSNESLRILHNNREKERQRRNVNKSALDAVKAMVPKLKYLEKPSKITILNATMEYVKILQKTEKEDLEEWEAEKKKFLKLKSKYKSLFV